MYQFDTYKWNEKTFINRGKHEYKNGEILNFYLNYDIESLEKQYLTCLKHGRKILFPIDADFKNSEYNKYVYKVQAFFTLIDGLMPLLPPYNKCLNSGDINNNSLIELLNKYRFLFKDGESEDGGYDNLDDMGYNEYGEVDDNGRIFLENFVPEEFEGEEYINDIENLNDDIRTMFNAYISFAEDILRVHYAYKNVLDNFVHVSSSYPNQYELAERIEKFYDYQENAHLPAYKKCIPAGNVSISHAILGLRNDKQELSILCQSYTFDNLNAFLYTELFDGLISGSVPKKCYNCGKYFLLTNGYYTDFCDNIAPGEKYKTCRDVGARKKYDDKVKNDPVWLVYQRAYKTHYARHMKKKMTADEFRIWGEFAIDLREKVINKEIDFAEYERLIRE